MIDSFFDSLPKFLEFAIRYASVLVVIIVPVAVFISYQKTRNDTKRAISAAEKLGLRYINVADKMQKDKKEESFLQNFLSAWSTWAMEGTYNDVKVQIELIVKSKQERYIPFSDRVSVSNPTRTTYSRSTAYIVSFKKPLPFDISIYQKIKMPFGLSHVQIQRPGEIKTGDEELDNMITISGSDESKIKEWLNLNMRNDTLKKLFKALPFVIIDNNGIRFRDSFSKADFDHIKNNLTILSETVLKLKDE